MARLKVIVKGTRIARSEYRIIHYNKSTYVHVILCAPTFHGTFRTRSPHRKIWLLWFFFEFCRILDKPKKGTFLIKLNKLLGWAELWTSRQLSWQNTLSQVSFIQYLPLLILCKIKLFTYIQTYPNIIVCRRQFKLTFKYLLRNVFPSNSETFFTAEDRCCHRVCSKVNQVTL